MKDDKFCFSKTLTYLVFMVAVVAGAFWFMNYANKQNVNTAPKAGGLKCTWSKAPRTCTQLGKDDNQTYSVDSTQNSMKNGAVAFYCCVLQKAANTPVGKTCKQNPGADWFRDTNAADLGKRLTTKWSKATATLINGASDAAYYKGKFCYKVAYKYTTEDAQGNTLETCREAGGTGWYRDATAADLSTRLSTVGYTVPVTDVTGPFSDTLYYPNSHCYKVASIQANANNSCLGQGGKWYGYASCALATKAWNPNGYSNDNFVDSPHSDTRTGFSCCKQK